MRDLWAVERGRVEKFYNEKELALRLGVSVATLRKWRMLAQGPKYRKLGKSVRYAENDIAQYLTECPSGGAGRHVA